VITFRRLLLTALTATIVVAPLGMTAANASFNTPASLPSMSLSTATVAAPGNVKGALTCASPNATMSATWTASPTAKVSGYQVNVYFSDGYLQTVQMASTATSWSTPITLYNVTAYKVQYSVTTQTSYGWTQESPRTGWFGC
jgi:hypothetical protein